MDANKLDLSAKQSGDVPASYKAIPETDMEEEAVIRSKNTNKPRIGSAEPDGADEKMLGGEDEKMDVKIEFKNLEDGKEVVNEKQNGDAKLDIGDLKTQFVGLTKEELMKYANDPFWVRLRWFLFITFWLLWASMLVGAVMIIYAAPKCDPPAPKTWWEQGPLTEIEPTIPIEDLEAQVNAGIQGFIIPYPGDAYAPLKATHSFDLVHLLKNASVKNVNVIVELEAGSSNVWFDKSEGRESDFDQFYIWKSAKKYSEENKPEPPNSWKVVDSNESSWKFSEIRKEFYYAPRGRPQLNLRNPNVSAEFSTVLTNFLALGAAGVQIKGVPWLLADANLEEENRGHNPGFVHSEYGFYSHGKTEHLAELGDLLQKWRNVVKSKSANGPFMSSEPVIDNIDSYKVNNSLVFDLPIEPQLFTNEDLNASLIVKRLDRIFNSSAVTAWPLWKYSKTVNDALEIVTFLLPGAPLVEDISDVKAELLKKRNVPSIMRGRFTYHLIANKSVVAFIRVTAGNPGILVAYNPTNESVVVNFPAEIEAVADEVTITLLSTNYFDVDLTVGDKSNANNILIPGKSTIVLSYVPKSQ